jgi:uncharacterized protein YxjI
VSDAARQDEKEPIGRVGTAETYQLTEQLLALGDDFWIETESGHRAFKVDGKLVSVRDKLSFEGAEGAEQAYIESKYFTVRDKLRIDRVGGSGALLQKDLINIVRDQFILSFDNGDEFEVHGNIVDHEYRFDRGQYTVAEVSKRWFRIADRYGVQVQPGEDDVVFLAAAVALDQSSHDAGPIDL